MSTHQTAALDQSSTKRKFRCAIYTRKSSEEGLEQDFNSLDAQREACSAYVMSQASEGWSLMPELYDDGGLSGGTLERPALQRLLTDIKGGRIDIIVVYKVDRLTRSLLDFAKLVEAFDTAEVSFVSVTQSFNTTTSMGRLTLNMLLSFAQFEREVTAERIRDKLAASKAKGMWMGGVPPLGYEPDGRTLKVVDDHASLIRDIYARYLASGNVRHVAEDLVRDRISVPTRTLSTGKGIGGGEFARGQIYKILSNPIYRGKIAHKDKLYDGMHAAIIEEETWEAVQAQLAEHSHTRRTRTERSKGPLAGLLFDEHGTPLKAVHTTKPVPGKPESAAKRYRYYIEQAEPREENSNRPPPLRIPASEIEPLVRKELKALFEQPLTLIEQASLDVPAALWPAVEAQSKAHAKTLARGGKTIVRKTLKQVAIHPTRVVMTIRAGGIAELLGLTVAAHAGDAGEDTATPASFEHVISAELKRSGLAVRLIQQNGLPAHAGQPDQSLVRMIHRARAWWDQLATGELTVSDLARAQGLSTSYVSRALRMAFLSPELVEAALAGTTPPSLNGKELWDKGAIPPCWQLQRAELLGR